MAGRHSLSPAGCECARPSPQLGPCLQDVLVTPGAPLPLAEAQLGFWLFNECLLLVSFFSL